MAQRVPWLLRPWHSVKIQLRRAKLSSNRGRVGGAVAALATSVDIQCAECSFTHNTAASAGGALYTVLPLSSMCGTWEDITSFNNSAG